MTDITLYEHVAFTTDNIAALPSVSLGTATEDLPTSAAIFFAIEAETNQILKIGGTANLALAVQEQLDALAYLPLPQVRLAWIQVSEIGLLTKLEQVFIQQFQPVMNGLDGKLKQVQDLTIAGWYDFQKINGELWGFYGNGVMPVPVPLPIAWEYKNELRENVKAIAKLEQTFGKIFTYSLTERNLIELRARIEAIETEQFVCPAGCYVSEYSVKRPYGIYYYYKLVALEPIFPAKSKLNKGKMVKTLHLGRFNSLQEAHEAAGWTARKAINKMQRQIELLEQVQEEMEQDRLQIEAHLSS